MPIDFALSAQQYPSPAYFVDLWTELFKSVGPLYTFSAFLPLFVQLVTQIVGERERKFDECLRVLNVPRAIFWLSWILFYAAVLAVVAALCVAVGKQNLFAKSDGVVVFLFLFLFGLSACLICCVSTTFFTLAKTASSVVGTMLFVFALPHYMLTAHSSLLLHIVVCILSPSAFALGLKMIVDAEKSGTGLTISTIFSVKHGPLSFFGLFAILVADCVFFALLTLLLDRRDEEKLSSVWKVWSACFDYLWEFFCKHVLRNTVYTHLVEDDLEMAEHDSTTSPENEDVEKEESDREIGIQLINLRKTYTTQRPLFCGAPSSDGVCVTALDTLSMSLYSNEIFVLLGHNGAGKTTTLSLLTGLASPSSGIVKIFGQTLTQATHDSLGFCPQHNGLLFDSLTVAEHLQLYCGLKGMDSAATAANTHSLIGEVGLYDKILAQSKTLSGGMKRRLSVALSFVGNPQVVCLDEPTSGLDPINRRAVWALLSAKKQNRVIMVTTHYMDEADLLADRVAILAHGRLRCAGSPLFLKHRFNIGYTLTLETKENFQEALFSPHVQETVGGALLKKLQHEISYRLPLGSVSKFSDFFAHLESEKESVGISGFGLSLTTLEDVFLAIAAETHVKDNEDGRERAFLQPAATETGTSATETTHDMEHPPGRNPTENSLSWHYHRMRAHIGILMRKKILLLKRDFKSIAQITIFPLLLVAVAGVVARQFPLNLESHSIVFSDDTYLEFENNNHTVIWAEARDSKYQEFIEDMVSCASESTQKIRNLMIPEDDVQQILLKESNNLLSLRAVHIQNISFAGKHLSQICEYNTTVTHSLPLCLASSIDVFFKKISDSCGDNQALPRILSHPLSGLSSSPAATAAALILSIYLAIGLAIVPGALVHPLILEKNSGTRHLQRVCGVSVSAYWISVFLSDAIVSIFPGFGAIFVLLAVGLFEFGDPHTTTLALLCVLHAVASLPFTYFFSFFFEKPETCQSALNLMYSWINILFLGIIVALDSANMYTASAVFSAIFGIFPGFGLANGMYKLTLSHSLESLYGRSLSPLSVRVAGIPVTMLFFEIFVFLGIVIWADRRHIRLFGKSSKNIPPALLEESETAFDGEDDDVHAERLAVQRGTSAAVVMSRIRKVYPPSPPHNIPLVALRSVSLTVRKGECFVLLGPNGAGKSTLIDIITSKTPATHGTATIFGERVDGIEFRGMTSLCPQSDALFDSMTVFEHLNFYASLKFPPVTSPALLANETMEKIGLSEHEHKLVAALSGGAKRKLSVGIAILFQSPLIILDEPSTGLDPFSRRNLWSVLTKQRVETGCGVILTTHSMEESEALGSRLSIVVGGALVCLGSSQHLKTKFGGGCRLEIKCANEAAAERAVAKLRESLPELTLVDSQAGRLKIDIPKQAVNLSSLFRTLEAAKVELEVREYALSQTTLDQLFVNFARHQREPEQ
eukprot:TRINITY_DN7830_c0_g1_i1.p1 TRINITY_DN7830_c0_g1~~TRINITY_DN7830_c0_g1_i1.p1  ORF type:complete len:1646 (-),score=406.48 TRINITY_DN7830_c0_g1_i1:239-4567(-)